MMTEETQLVAHSSTHRSGLLSMLQEKRRFLGAVVLCIIVLGAGLRMGTMTTTDTIIAHGNSNDLTASMMAFPTNEDSWGAIPDDAGICAVPTPYSQAGYNPRTDYCFRDGPSFCWTTTYDCLPTEEDGPREGVSGRGDGQCGFPCVLFDIRMRDCYESHGSYDSQKDYCFGGEGGKRCWSHQDCKPKGSWGGLSGIGNNECGPPCQEFQNNPIFTEGCCTLGIGPLTATLDVFNKQDCEAERETTVLLRGQWNAACDCRTKDGKWTGWTVNVLFILSQVYKKKCPVNRTCL